VPKVSQLRADDPGHVGQHRLTGRISGMPGTGPFYLARAPDGAAVVLRLLSGSWTHDPAARDRFAAEAGAAQRVPAYCAARILDAGVEGERAYLVSEYVPGPSLLETVRRDRWARGAELEALALGSAAGLAAVHQAGLVHGNFGPDHLILSADGPQVIEFGITPPYGPATPSADMMAWAQTMVFAVIGRPAAALEDLDALPGPLRAAVADCLGGDPALRPAARDIVADLLGDASPGPATLAAGASRAAALYQSVHPPGDAAEDWAAEDPGYPPAGPRAHPARGHGTAHRGGHGGGPGHGGAGHGAHGAGPQHHGSHGTRPGGGPPGARPHGTAAARRGAGPPGRRLGTWPIAAAAVVVIAVAAVVLHLLTEGGGSGQAADRTQGGVTQTQSGGGPASPSGSATPSPSATAKVPASFAGTWSGQAKQLNPADVFDVRVSLDAGAATGSVSYSSASFSCAGQLSLQAASHAMLTLRQGIIRGQHTCANGTVTLATNASGALAFSFRGKTGPAASGTLTRSS